MKGILYTTTWGVIVWLFAIVFFRIFGEWILISPGTNFYITSIFCLLFGTALLLWLVTSMYLRFDKADNAALKFGVIGTIVGLVLDSVALSNHNLIFPQLADTQVIAFTVWMSFAYALYLFIPAMIHRKKGVNRLK